MTCVDFYILPDDQLSSLFEYACKLAQKNWQSGNRVLIQTDSAQDSQQLDDLLWNISADSFLPHAIATLEPVDQQQPILISHQKIIDNNFQQVINLSSRPADIQPDSDRNSEQTGNTALRINEILNQDEQRKQASRVNYKTYRELGYTLEHHTLETPNG